MLCFTCLWCGCVVAGSLQDRMERRVQERMEAIRLAEQEALGEPSDSLHDDERS